jgi:methyl-accepting chemotaxis protein
MKLKIKLSLTVILLIAAIITISSVVTLNRSSELIIKEAQDYAMQISETYAVTLQKRFESYIRPAMTLSEIFGEYYSTPLELRRTFFNELLESIINRHEDYTGMWTAWLPNALDGKDATEGRYITCFTRRNGYVEPLPGGYEGWEDYMNNQLNSPYNAMVSGPIWRVVAGKEVPVITVTYKVINEQTKQAVGVVGLNYITSMQDFAVQISKELYDGKGIAGFYNEKGITVAHLDDSRIKSYIGDNPKEIALLGDRMSEVLYLIRNGGNPKTMTLYSETLGTDVHEIYYPVSVFNTGMTYTMAVGVPMNEVTKGVREMSVFVIIFSVISIIISAIIAFVIAIQIVRPIIQMSLALKDISQGEGDLTKVIQEKGKDETSDMAHYFNLTLKKIKDLVITIKRQSGMLSDIGNDLASNMNETAAAVNEIAANIQSVKGRVMNQSASVTETNATMEQITENIKKLNKHVERQSTSVSQSSSSIEEMLANIQSVTDTLVRNAANVHELMDASEVGKNGLQEVASDIQEIANESAGLLEINSVMENIASQTNLLSMNAAIEAAHAGESGKGFAVVADEIRKLAMSSSDQSKTISIVLKRIKNSIDKITLSTANVLNKFEAIDSRVKTVADQEENIRNAMEEQAQGSKQILDAIGQVNDITQNVKSGSEEMFEGSKQVLKEGSNLERVTQEITGGMNEMAIGSEQINVAVNQVNDLSEKNRENIDLLVKEVSRFKVE